MADLPTLLAFELAALAVVVWSAVAVLALRRRQQNRERSLAAEVPAGEIIQATWVHGHRAAPEPVDERPPPYVWRNRNRPHPYTGVVCDKTQREVIAHADHLGADLL